MLALSSPPRSLSPALRAWAMQRFAPKLRLGVLIFVGLANTIGGVVFLSVYFQNQRHPANSADDLVRDARRQSLERLEKLAARPEVKPAERERIKAAEARLQKLQAPIGRSTAWMLPAGVAWIALDLLLISGIIVFSKLRGAATGKRMLRLLEEGNVARARVLENQRDYSVQLNGAPRRVVTLDVDGQAVKMVTFDVTLADLFPAETVVEVLFHSSIPDFAFPVSKIPISDACPTVSDEPSSPHAAEPAHFSCERRSRARSLLGQEAVRAERDDQPEREEGRQVLHEPGRREPVKQGLQRERMMRPCRRQGDHHVVHHDKDADAVRQTARDPAVAEHRPRDRRDGVHGRNHQRDAPLQEKPEHGGGCSTGEGLGPEDAAGYRVEDHDRARQVDQRGEPDVERAGGETAPQNRSTGGLAHALTLSSSADARAVRRPVGHSSTRSPA